MNGVVLDNNYRQHQQQENFISSEWYGQYLLNSRYLTTPTLTELANLDKQLPDNEFYPYQLLFSRLEKIPFGDHCSRYKPFNYNLPSILPQTYSPTFGKFEFGDVQLSLTFFDKHTMKFFGNTFTFNLPLDNFDKIQESWSPRRNSLPVANLQTETRLTGNLKNKNIFFHSNLTSQDIMIVIEISEKRDNGTDRSLGWSFFHPFNPSKGGIDANTIWNFDGAFVHQKMNLPVFQGSPRVLLIPYFSVNDFQNLVPYSHASLSLKLSVCPEIQPYCTSWPKNIFADEYLLPIEVEDENLFATKIETFTVSRIELTTTATSFIDMETRLMNDTWDSYIKAHPELSIHNPTRKCQIIERRANVGFHNSYFYSSEPAIVHLEAHYDEHTGEPTKCFFGGKLELKKIKRTDHQPTLQALTITVEYKVKLDLIVPPAPKSLLENIKDSISPTFDPTADHHTPLTVIKDISLGWMFSEDNSSARNIMLLHGGALNPQKKFSYVDVDSSENSRTNDPIVHGLSLSFDVYKEIQKSIKRSPSKKKPVLMAPKQIKVESKRASVVSIPVPPQESKPQPVVEPIVPPPVVEIPSVFVDKLVYEDRATSVPDFPTDATTSMSRLGLFSNKVEEIQFQQEKKEVKTPEEVIPPKPIPNVQINRQVPQQPIPIPQMRQDDLRFSQAGFIKSSPLPKHKTLVDPNKEFKDFCLINQFELLLMGANFYNPASKNPSTLAFSVKFYQFEEMKTELVDFYSGALPRGRINESWIQYSPGIIYQYGQTQLPGLKLQFEVDLGKEFMNHAMKSSYQSTFHRHQQLNGSSSFLDSSLNNNNNTVSFINSKTPFIEYMENEYLHIDLWNPETHFHLGTARVPLSHFLRQGRSKVSYDVETEIQNNWVFSMDYQDPIVHDLPEIQKSIGKLYFKLSNVGKPGFLQNSPNFLETISTSLPHFQILSALHSSTGNSSTTTSRTNTVDMKKLVDVHSDLQALLDHKKTFDKVDFSKDDQLSYRIQKLNQFYKMYPDLAPKGLDEYKIFTSNLKQQQDDLRVIEEFRERTSKIALNAHVRTSVTSKHTVRPSLGEAFYLEWEFVNPYNEEHSFLIEWHDTDLVLINDAHKQMMIKQICQDANPSSFKIFSSTLSSSHYSNSNSKHIFCGRSSHGLKSSSSQFQLNKNTIIQRQDHHVFLYANEAAIIPFVFQTRDEISLRPRTIQVAVRNNKFTIMAQLELQVSPRGTSISTRHVIFAAEKKDFHAIIPFITRSNDTAGYIVCNQAVECSVPSDQPSHLRLAIKSRNLEKMKKFHVFEYEDEALYCLRRVHEFDVYHYEVLDVSHKTDDLTHSTIIITGGSKSRSIICHADDPNDLKLSSSPSILPAKTLVNISFQLKNGGLNRQYPYLLHVIDQQTKQVLQRTMIVNASLNSISMKTNKKISNNNMSNINENNDQDFRITKTMEVILPTNQRTAKRLMYSNTSSPTTGNRTLMTSNVYIQTNRPDLIDIETPVLQLAPLTSDYIHLHFLSYPIPSVHDVHLFILNELQELEECVLMRIRYVE